MNRRDSNHIRKERTRLSEKNTDTNKTLSGGFGDGRSTKLKRMVYNFTFRRHSV